MVTESIRRELVLQAVHLKPIINIGKSGITQTLLLEIEKHLKKRKLVKLKILKNSDLTVQELETILFEKFNIIVIKKIGSVITVYKE